MPSPSIAGRLAVLAGACVLPLLLCGCPERTTHAAAPPAPTPVSPSDQTIMTVAPDTTALPPSSAPATPPRIPIAREAVPLDLPAETTGPARPRRPAESAAKPDDLPVVRPQPPEIRPQLSPQDLAALQRGIHEDTAAAEYNLKQASGKQLTAAQQEIVEEVQSYLKQSQQSSGRGDWQGAAILAGKARSTSQVLIKSL